MCVNRFIKPQELPEKLGKLDARVFFRIAYSAAKKYSFRDLESVERPVPDVAQKSWSDGHKTVAQVPTMEDISDNDRY